MIKTYESPKLTLAEDEVFVFGANLQSFHAGGAAGWATSLDHEYNWRLAGYDKLPDGTKGKWNEKGKLGPQVGTEGKSYAIPTVTRAGAKRSIPLETIKGSIQAFYSFAKSRTHLKFFVAQEKSGGLNGYSGQEMASIYAEDIPDNVYFSEEFAKLIEEKEIAPKEIIAPESRQIIHCKRGKFDIYIGRPPLGQYWDWKYGNPFEIGKDGDRKIVIEKYERWLVYGDNCVNNNATPERRQWILDHIHELKGKTLGCWCDYPKEDCHGRVLLEHANKS